MIEIPKFKARALKRLMERGEERRAHPIVAADLFSVPACPVCGSGESSPVAEVCLPDGLKFFATSVCWGCLCVFRPISPSRDWFRKCWRTIAEDDPQVFNPEMEEFRAARYRQCRDLLTEHVEARTVLDVGAGYGTGAKVFLDAGCLVSAVEPERNRAKYLRNRLHIPVVELDVERLLSVPFINMRFDLVVFAQCLEHTEEPGRVMRNIGRLLNPGGVVYVEVPFVWTIAEWSDALYLAHKSNFTERNLRYLMRSSGFEILKVVNFQNGPEEPIDLGLVLRVAEKSQDNELPKIGEAEIGRIKRLYRKGLPEDCASPLEETIRYCVPRVEHFFYTLRLDKITIERRGDILHVLPEG